MRIAVIDIGSNTIKMTVFDITDKAKDIFSKTIHAKLSAHIKDGDLSDKGIRALTSAVNSLRRSARSFACKKQNIYAFATACVRNAKNRDRILGICRKMTKLNVALLSGEEEAQLCLMGALSSHDCPKSGVLADLGGGSCEFVSFENSSLIEKVSLNIGALAMYKKFVSGRYISKDEMSMLGAYLKNEMSHLAGQIKLPDNGKFILTGGTARATVKLISKLSNTSSHLPHTVSLDTAKELRERIISGELDDMLEKEVGERAETLPCGLAIFIAASEILNADSFTVVSGGAREGFIRTIIMKGK